MRAKGLRPFLRLLTPSIDLSGACQTRRLHQDRPAPKVPQPRPFVPDVQTFLTLIGRELSKHASKFPSWESLFSLTSPQLKELGIEPARTRRYLLRWMQKYRLGELGPGADFQFVKGGEALLKVATPPPSIISDSKWVVNVPHDAQAVAELSTLPRPKGYKVSGLWSVSGPYARPLPGIVGSVVTVTEGMWEHRRGHKVDGGERRRTEVRFKKRSAERRARREEALGLQ